MLALLGCLVATPFLAWVLLNRKAPSQEEYAARQFAKHSGLSGDTLLSIWKANENIRSKRATAKDWNVVESNSKSSSMEFRATSEMALAHLKGTEFEHKAVEVLHRLADDPDAGVKTIAIRALFRIGHPQAKKFLSDAQASNEPSIKAEADKIATAISSGKRL